MTGKAEAQAEEGAALRPRVLVLAATALMPFGLGYALSYLYRMVNAVLAPHLATELGLGAADLGFLTSAYFIAFAAFQIPLGVLLDRFGPRRVMATLLVIAAAGATIFALAGEFWLLSFGRALIGLGVSAGLMASLKANTLWWPRERLPLVNGISGAFGTAGALIATVPVELLLDPLGWRGIFAALAAITVLVAILILCVVPEKPGAAAAPISVARQVKEMKTIWTSAYFWRVTVVVFVHQGTFLAYQTLWIAPWLGDVAGMDRIGVANGLFLFNFGQFAGVLVIGAIADRAQRFGVRPYGCVGVGVAFSILAQTLLALKSTAIAYPLCAAFGFFGSATLLVYAVLGQHFSPSLGGRVNTLQNLLVFSTAFAAQWGVGAIINLWPQIGEGRYDPAAHQAAFLTLIALEVLAMAWSFWPRRGKG
ncbi:MAG: MFS transporter [Rhodospirillales bacterium]|nr:MFS transporter [Rhodospirillales bacterium]